MCLLIDATLFIFHGNRYSWTAEWTPSSSSSSSPSATASGVRSAAATATFETGPIKAADWGNAVWVSAGGSSDSNPKHPNQGVSLGLIRKDFTLPASATSTTVAWARAYVASPGCAVLQVNGVVPSNPDYRGVCPWVVNPGSSDATKRNTRYMVHDITAQVTTSMPSGKNTVGLIAGKVMDSSQSIVALIMVQLADGSKPFFVSTGDAGWMRGPSYYNQADAWNTNIDWNKEEAGWSTTSFAPSSAWTAVGPATSSVMPARALMMPFTTVLNEVKPVLVEQLNDGAYLYTFPKNFVGTVRVKAVEGAVAGSRLSVQAGEWLSSKGPAPPPPPAPPTPPPGPPATCKANVPENSKANLGGCPAGQKIASVTFASFGTPTGECKSGFHVDAACNAKNTVAVVEKLCVGKSSCTVGADVDTFNGDPCPGNKKRLSVQVACSKGYFQSMATNGVSLSNSSSKAMNTGRYPHVGVLSSTASALGLPPLPPRPDDGTWPTISSKTQCEVHTLRPGNTADLETAFCWHGFQYVRVTPANGSTGFTGALDAIVGLEMHTNMSETGAITFGDGAAAAAAVAGGTSDPAADVLNGIFSMTMQSQRTNVAAYIPTDCPTREKHGWMGDLLDASEQAMYNFDTRAMHSAFMQTIEDNQGPGGDVPVVIPAGTPPKGSCNDIAWTSAYPQLHDMMHTYYGDTRVAARRWPSLVLYQENLIQKAATDPQHIAKCDQFKDWLCGEAQSCCSGLPANSSCPVGPEMGAFNYVLGLRAMADMATFLGNNSASVRYAALANNAADGFHATFYNTELNAYGGDIGAAQSLTTPALQINAMPAALKQPVVDYLAHDLAEVTDFQPFVGAVTSKILLNVLSDNNLHETALKTATTTTQPSWGYWWTQNSTTCWESWSVKEDPFLPRICSRTPTTPPPPPGGGAGDAILQ